MRERRRKRGRPKTSEAERQQMRATIETEALRLFESEGFEAISMRRLAREVGCSPMTLYSYFENKVDILRALWAIVYEELFDGLHEQISRERDSSQRLRILAIGYVDYWIAHQEHYRMVFMSAGVSQTEVSVFVHNDTTTQRFAIFVECLTNALPDHSPAEIKCLLDLLLSTLHGIAHCQITMSGYEWTDSKSLVDTFLRGLSMDNSP